MTEVIKPRKDTTLLSSVIISLPGCIYKYSKLCMTPEVSGSLHSWWNHHLYQPQLVREAASDDSTDSAPVLHYKALVLFPHCVSRPL